jgi:hypothetical protein
MEPPKRKIYLAVKYDGPGEPEAHNLKRNDADGAGVTVFLHPTQEAAVVVEIFQGSLLVHVWNGLEQSHVNGDPPETIIVTDAYSKWYHQLSDLAQARDEEGASQL